MLENESGNMVMPVSPMGNNGNGMFGDGAWWLIILFVLLFGNNGWGNQNGTNGLYPWMNQSNQMNDGFRDQMLNTSIQGINGQLNGLQMQVCNGFGQAEISANARQMADMNQMFGFQTAVTQGQNALQAQLAQCCCDNRLATEQLRATVAQENCADREALNYATRDLTAAMNAGFQGIKDQLCDYRNAQKDDTIAQLRQELLYARGQAATDVQTAAIRAGQATTANQLIQEMRSCPVPSMPVYGMTPIFTCPQNQGCGCGGFAA